MNFGTEILKMTGEFTTLTPEEREKLEAEYKELWELADYLHGLLADITEAAIRCPAMFGK